jgi:uncharacterized membrane protein
MDELRVGPDGNAVLPQPGDIPEKEKSDAMGAYLMMFAAVAIGLPLPFLNIIAAVVYFIVNKKSRFAAFHAYQSLISQISVSLLNAALVIWIVWGFIAAALNDYAVPFLPPFFIYLGITIVANLLYTIFSIIGCVKASKGVLYYMPLFGRIAFNKYYGKDAVKRQEENISVLSNRPPGE